MFGVRGSGDTSGYSRLAPPISVEDKASRPFGGYFDEVADSLDAALRSAGSTFTDAIERVVIFRDEMTLHVERSHLPQVARRLRDESELRFELCLGVDGVHYPQDTGRELHAAYPFASITHNRRIRLEVSVPDSDPHIPSIVGIYPTNDWHERETYDFFGIVFDGHPALTRIEMPDDWKGHPQRKDYPLGGIPVEYKGAQTPPPDERSNSGATTETVVTASGQDWDDIVTAAARQRTGEAERIVVNMGPQHPSTHGVLRLILEIEGETVVEARCGIGYLHTGIEKNLEYRNWTQGVTFVTRMDYLSPFFNETAYCLGVEKLLDITDDIPERATVIRVMMMELNRISSHLVALATGGMELGAVTAMLFGFRERELILDVFETITGLRMNHAYIRPGGLAQDLPDGSVAKVRELLKVLPKRLRDVELMLSDNSIWKARTQGIGYLDLTGCMALGVTGPVLRATGLPHDQRRAQPYCGYENYEFDVVTHDGSDCYGRYVIRVEEMKESLKIVEQCLDKLQPGPVMVDDKKIAWPADLAVGPDGLGNSQKHIAKIMESSMEGLIHHFKLVTEGIRVPPGQVYVAVESPRGELGVHMVSDGGTRPYRVHFRDPSFTNLQAVAAMCEGGMVSDVIASVASIDPVMGGVDR
eukprot:gene24731-29665_t